MAKFCDQCGRQLGFFSSKKWVTPDGTQTLLCKSCFGQIQSGSPADGSESGRDAGDAGRSEPARGGASSLGKDALTTRLEAFRARLTGKENWVRLFGAIVADLLLYGPTPDGVAEGFDLMMKSRGKYEDPQGAMLVALMRYAQLILEDDDKVRALGLEALMAGIAGELRMEVLLTLARAHHRAGEASKAAVNVEEAEKLALTDEARARVEEVKALLL